MDGGPFGEKSINSVSKSRRLAFSAASNYVTQVVSIHCNLSATRGHEGERKTTVDFDTRRGRAPTSIIS